MFSEKIAWKIGVTGMKGSGKSSIISRIVYGTFDLGGRTKPFFKKAVTFKHESKNVTADIFFQEIENDHGTEKLYFGMNLIIVAVDILNKESVDYAISAIKNFKVGNKKLPLVVVGNKSDMKYEAEIWKEDLEYIKEKFETEFFIVSAKTGEGIPELLNYCVDIMKENYYAKE